MRMIHDGEEYRLSFDKYDNQSVKLAIFDPFQAQVTVTKHNPGIVFPFILFDPKTEELLPGLIDSFKRRGFELVGGTTYLIPEDLMLKLQNEFSPKKAH